MTEPNGDSGQRPPEFVEHLAGVPDALQRLWTPYRMAYIEGENKPAGSAAGEQCPFCRGPQHSDADSLIVHRGKYVFAILNLYPYNPGHMLICPYRHISGYVDTTHDESEEIAAMTKQGIAVVSKVSKPVGFNIGMNQGAVAGAGIAAHLHQHIVPRWQGDANFLPVIGRTKALPQLLSQTRELFAHTWDEMYGPGEQDNHA